MRTANHRVVKGLFLIWSFSAFIFAVAKIRDKKYHGVILAFSFMYGYMVYAFSGDITRYAELFKYIYGLNTSQAIDYVIWSYLGQDYIASPAGRQPDLYATGLQFLVSRFTDNPRWFWGAASLIYTYVFLKFFREAMSIVSWNGNRTQLVFFAFLLTIVPFYVGVTGIRFWTALFLFCLFTLRGTKAHPVKNVALAFLSILIHFSFFLPCLILLGTHLVRGFKATPKIVAIASLALFFGASNISLLGKVNESTSVLENTFMDETVIQERINSYSNPEAVVKQATVSNRTNWYVRARTYGVPAALVILYIFEFALGIKLKKNEYLRSLEPLVSIMFAYTLLTFGLGSIARFQYIFFLLAFVRYLVLAGDNTKSKFLRLGTISLVPMLVLHVVVTMRAGFYTVDPLLLISNPISTFFWTSERSLSELIVGH